MPSPTLLLTPTTSATCTDITITDSTADYGAGTVTVNECTGLVMVVTLSGGSYLTFTFTLVNGVITVATLGLSGATPVSILAKLASTVFPLSAFSIWRAYGVTVPTFTDGVVNVTYTITGTHGGLAFSYTTSKAQTIICSSLCCCLQKSNQNIDLDCEDEDAMWNYLKSDLFSTIAVFATQVGNTTRAQLAIDKATEICNCGCSDCD